MEYAFEMGSDAMIHIRIFIKIDSDIQNLIGEEKQICRRHGYRISLLLFFEIRKGG
jgi:hypothetical protein